MNRIKLSDEEWARILASLKKLPGVHIGLPDICRQFVNGSLWILRTGAHNVTLPVLLQCDKFHCNYCCHFILATGENQH